MTMIYNVAWTAWAAGLAFALSTSGPLAQTDWREEVKVLRVGFLSTGEPATTAIRLEPFRAYLEGRVGIPVELVPAATYEALIDSTIDDHVHYAIHSATSFAIAEQACDCVEPLAVPAAYDGSTGFHSVLLVRADSPLRTLTDVRGKRIALSAEDSIAGRLLPLAELAGEGIDPDSHFSEVVTMPGPEAAVIAVLSGTADVAVGWSSLAGDPATGYSFGLLTRMVIDGRLPVGAVRVIWQSSLIPFGPHAVSVDLPSELKLLLADALFDMAFTAPDVLEAVDRSGFGGGGFVAIDPGAYAALEALIATR